MFSRTRTSTNKGKHGRGRRRWAKWLVGSAVGALFGIGLLWFAVHRFDWAGPLVANSLRALVGAKNVTWLEESVYGIEDGYNQLTRRGERPKAYWSTAPAPLASASAPPALPASAMPPFRPQNVGPVHESWSAPGDGAWVAIRDPRWPNMDPPLYKTLLHPDRNRSWAELFVVAIDLRRLTVNPCLGTREPAPNVEPPPKLKRPGVIPEQVQSRVMAAFNGGFMTEHGRYGMMLDGQTIVKPHGRACTIAMYKSGKLGIAAWESVENSVSEMTWYRQTPNCMVEEGKLHPALAGGRERHWGATLDGDTVIRRSAIGLDASGTTLYVSISNHTTAKVVAEGMLHAGAVSVAQLDVNWSYPKFVLFSSPAPGEPLQAVALAEGFEFRSGEYLRDRSLRDFFYLSLAEAE